MKAGLYILFFVGMVGLVRAQHNSDYLQYMFNGLLVNPAFAGSRNALDVTTLYRKQWMGFYGAPVTASFGGHMPLSTRKSNVGLVLVNDVFGIFNHQKAAAVYAYRFPFLKGKLSLGLQAGVDYYTANWHLIRTIRQSDPAFTIYTERKILPTAGTGIFYHSDILYAGVAVPELFYNDISPYRTGIFHSGFVVPASGQIRIKPAFLIKYMRNSPLLANISATFYWKEIIGLGVGYTNNTSAMTFMDLKIKDQLRLGYGYEYLFSKLSNYSSGSHEIMLRYIFRYRIESASARYF